ATGIVIERNSYIAPGSRPLRGKACGHSMPACLDGNKPRLSEPYASVGTYICLWPGHAWTTPAPRSRPLPLPVATRTSAPPLASHQLQLEGLEHCPGAVAHAQLAQYVGHVVLDRAL